MALTTLAVTSIRSRDAKAICSPPIAAGSRKKQATRRHRIWKRTWIGFCVGILFIIAGGMPILWTFLYLDNTTVDAFRDADSDDCNGVGLFSAGSLLAPDVTGGNFTLVEARAIDLSWNLVAGRVIPFLMASLSCRIGGEAIVRIAERSAVTYNAFAALTIDSNTVSGLWHLFKAVVLTSGWRAKWTLGFLAFSTLLLFSLPTLISTEAGYVRNQGQAYQLRDGSIVLGLSIGDRVVARVCVDGNGYRWGISFWVFTITHGLIAFWAVGMFGIWIDTSRKSNLVRGGRRMGMWRAIADLGFAVKRDLGEDVDAWSDEELGLKLAKCRPLMYSIRHEGGPDAKVILAPHPDFEGGTKVTDMSRRHTA